MIVAIDVDSTLYDSSELFSKVAAKHFELHLPFDQQNWHDCHKYADVKTLVKVFRKAHSREYVEQNEPYPDAADVCQMILDKGNKIYYVSDRHPQAYTALRDWLVMYGFYPDGDHNRKYDSYDDNWVVVGKDKRSWLSEKKPDIVIDDRVRTMIHARDFGATVFSIEQTWNVNLKDEIPGINILPNWEEIGKKIEEYL